MLRTIIDGPTSEFLVGSLASAVIAEALEDSETEELSALTALLFRRQLANHSPATLKDRPARLFGQHGIDALLKSMDTTIFSDRVLAEAWKTLLAAEDSRSNIAQSMELQFASLFGGDERSEWSWGSRALLESVRAVMVGLGTGIEDASAPETVGKRVLTAYLRDCSKVAFGSPWRNAAYKADPQLKGISDMVDRYLVDGCHVTHRHFEDSPGTAGFAGLLAFISAVSEKFAESFGPHIFSHEQLPPLYVDLGTSVIEAAGNGGVAFDQNVIVTRSFHDKVRGWMLSLHEFFLEHTDRTLLVLSKSPPSNLSVGFDALWRDRFVREVSTWTNIWEYVPWDQFSAVIYKEVIRRSIGALVDKECEWEVTLAVRNLSLGTPTTQIDDVEFFDPQVIDHGEGWLLRLSGDSGKVIGATTVVRADSLDSALEKAELNVQRTLTLLSFARSANRTFGLKAEIDPSRRAARRKDTDQGYGMGHKSRSTSHVVEDCSSDAIQSIAKAFHRLRRRAENSPSDLTEIEDKFLKGVEWYRRARWEDDLSKAFIGYWIALEQIFAVAGSSDKKLFEKVPALLFTWRKLDAAWALFNMRDSMIDQIDRVEGLAESIEHTPKLEAWKSDDRTLFVPANAELLVSLIPSQHDAIRQYAERYRKDLQHVADHHEAIQAQILDGRERRRFTLSLLNKVRNDLVHSAGRYDRSIDIYVRSTERVLLNVLEKMLPYAIADHPECRTLEDLIKAYEPPWC